MTDALSERRERVANRMTEQGAEAMLVSGLPNVRYLSGYTGSNGIVLLSPGAGTLFTDPRYTIQAAAESDCHVVTAKGPLIAAAAKVIHRRRLKRVGFEFGRLSYAAWSELRDALGREVQLVPLPGYVEQERMVKSSGEIELIRQSVLTNSRAYQRVLTRLKPTATENDVAAEIEYGMRRFGAEGPAFESIVAAGEHSALPHARPGREPIGTNRILLMDVGALQAGYCSDMTRVVYLGSPGRKFRGIYNAVLQAQLTAIDAVRAGTTAAAVDRAARSVLKRHGLEKAFVHSTGHGLGLEIHETPRVGRKDKTRLEAGMVITIEPGAYIEGFGGVRIEDTVVVTQNGCEVLTPTSKELLSV